MSTLKNVERGNKLEAGTSTTGVHAARTELCRRLGQTAEARASYERTLGLTQQEPEQRFLKRRLSELPD